MQVHTGDMIHASHAFLLLVYWYHHIWGMCAPYGINYHQYGFLSFGVVLNKYAFRNGRRHIGLVWLHIRMWGTLNITVAGVLRHLVDTSII